VAVISTGAGDCQPGLSIQADTRIIRRASTWLVDTGRHLCIPADQINRLDLCLNEVLANIIMHGGEAVTSSPILLELQARHQHDKDAAMLTVSDGGIAFDPVSGPINPAPTSLDEAEPGGLGLLMIRKFTDGLSYEYKDNRNILTLTVQWTAEPNE